MSILTTQRGVPDQKIRWKDWKSQPHAHDQDHSDGTQLGIGYHSIEESCQWAQRLIHKMMADDDPMDIYSASLLNLVCNLNDLKFSTAFSGIDSPGTALMDLGEAARLIMIDEAEKAGRFQQNCIWTHASST